MDRVSNGTNFDSQRKLSSKSGAHIFERNRISTALTTFIVLVPLPPSGLKTSDVTSDSITLSWTESKSADNYTIKYCEPSENITLCPFKQTPNASTTYQLAGLKAGTEYIFSMFATGPGGNSTLSQSARQFTGTEPI